MSIDETSIYYYGKHVLETIICDLIYTLLKPHAVIAKDMGEEITPAGFGTMVERIGGGVVSRCVIYTRIYTTIHIFMNHLNKFEICQYVVSTDIGILRTATRLYAVDYDVFGRLKMVRWHEACIEKAKTTIFILHRAADRIWSLTARRTYGGISIEGIKGVMAPYGLKYGEENKEEEIQCGIIRLGTFGDAEEWDTPRLVDLWAGARKCSEGTACGIMWRACIRRGYQRRLQYFLPAGRN